jgi:hypothetical protein
MMVMATDLPVQRAKTEAGEVWDDPSEDLLFELLMDIERGEGSFLIVELTADPNGETYVQAMRGDDGSYIVEYREGSADRHYGTVAADMRAAHKLLAGCACEIPGWQQDAQWTRVRI